MIQWSGEIVGRPDMSVMYVDALSFIQVFMCECPPECLH